MVSFSHIWIHRSINASSFPEYISKFRTYPHTILFRIYSSYLCNTVEMPAFLLKKSNSHSTGDKFGPGLYAAWQLVLNIFKNASILRMCVSLEFRFTFKQRNRIGTWKLGDNMMTSLKFY